MELTSRVVRIEQLTAAEIALWETYRSQQAFLQNPFYSPLFVRTVAHAHPLVFICVIEHNGRALGFFPFQYRNAVQRGLRSASCVGEDLADHCGLIAHPDLHLDPTSLLRLSRLNYFYFTHLDVAQLGHGLSSERTQSGPILEFPPNGAGGWQPPQMGKAFISETARRERQLQKHLGPLRFEWHTDDGAEVERIIDMKRRQYRRTGVNDALAELWKRRVLQTLAGYCDPGCTGVVSRLYAGDTWVASHLGLRTHRVMHYWFPVYNPELARYAPGRLLIMRLIAAAHAAGVREFDHGGGESAAKRKFANGEHLYYRGAWYRRGLSAFVCRGTDAARWRLAAMWWRAATAARSD